MTHRIGHLTTVEHQVGVYKSLFEEKERQVDQLARDNAALRAELAAVRRDAENS